MEAYPFADEIANILSNYWKTPEGKHADLPGLPTIERIRDLVVPALKSKPEDADFLEQFIAKSDDRNLLNEFGSRLKRYLYYDQALAGSLEDLAREYRDLTSQSIATNVNIEWGESIVSGSTAQVKQDRKVEVDTIDLSKFIDP